MKEIFERGSFSNYRITDSQLNEARTETRTFSEGGRFAFKTAVFLSHKHSDLEELKGIIGFLRHCYKVDIYIDSMDANMPKVTSGETAERIKKIIRKCDRFILLATNDAIESKWCNWELGFGDAQKYSDKIALFPIKDKGAFDSQYKGNEYMQIYPYIAHYNGSEKYKGGMPIEEGYYVCSKNSDGTKTITPLKTWLNDATRTPLKDWLK